MIKAIIFDNFGVLVDPVYGSLAQGLSSESIRDMQDARRIERAEENDIFSWYNDLTYQEKMDGVTIQRVFDGAIKKDGITFNQLYNQIIPPILKNVLKLKYVRKMVDYERKYVFIPTDKTWKVVREGDKILF